MNTTSGAPRAYLRKEIGRFGFFCLAFGAMIGVGWVTAMGSWLREAGPVGSALAFALGGLLMIFIGICYAEVTAMLPLSGGEVAYAYKAFGTFEAFLVGWFLAFGYLSVSAFEAISIGRIISYLFPAADQWPLYTIQGDVLYGSHLLIAVVFVTLITASNYFGVKHSMRIQIYLTVIFIVLVSCIALAGIAGGKISNLQPYFMENPSGGIWSGVIAVFATVPFWLVGFDTIPQGAEEARESVSPRVIGLMILISIVVAVSFYIILIFSTAMVGDWKSLLGQDLLTSRIYEMQFGSGPLVKSILVAIIIGLLTSWNGFFLAGSRVLFAMGRGRIIHAQWGETHPIHNTPHKSVLFCGVVTMAATFLGRGSMIAFVDVGSLCIAIAFLGVSLSFLRLRSRHRELRRPYLAPGGKWIGYLSVAGSVLILLAITVPGSPATLKWPLEWMILISLVAGGLLFWGMSRSDRDKMTSSERDQSILGKYK